MSRWALLGALLVILALMLPGCTRPQGKNEKPMVRVGAKAFPESQILGEMLRLLAREVGADVEDLRSLGDTGAAWNALLLGRIDAYCEYTGTLTQQVLADEDVATPEKLRRALAKRGLRMSRSLGFANSYGLGMTRKHAAKLDIHTISDLRKHPKLTIGLSAPFLDRPDGWRALRKFYDLPQDTRDGMEHALAYTSLSASTLDVTDVYTTDAAIHQRDLIVLADDRHFFPSYDAIILYRADLDRRAPQAVDAFLRLEGTISESAMIDLNVRVGKEKPLGIAASFLRESMKMPVEVRDETLAERELRWTGQHLMLVAVSLTLAILVAVPLGIAAARHPRLGYFLLAAISIVQTIPALALLVLLLVLMNRIGPAPAIAALFLYSLLPIVRNTYTGLHDIPLPLRESAEALGLSPWPRLYLIELPLASRAILAGIKTAAVINVGYATLGGLIGAGGYGQPIMDGVTRNDPQLILEGALPAVVMALLVQALFEGIERFVVPRGLRLRLPA
ncbi:MAG TPA: glycine betaine ABC transporter substrate-binding protein [Gemmataceae bacterium]|nr:glycine betaine ABC transporter substrate-binding protein [Gemmataceae bacterium]